MEATKTYTVEMLANMGKEELRQACRDLGVSYSKLNNDGMRKLLQDVIIPVQHVEEEKVEEAEDTPAQPSGFSSMLAQLNGTASVQAALAGNVTKVRDGKVVGHSKPADSKADEKSAPEKKQFNLNDGCPLCGADHGDTTWANEGVSCLCHRCGKTFSATTGREIRAGHTRPNASKGYTIQKDRAVQNGVKRPSEGTVCGTVWAEFDKNPDIRAKDLPALAEAHGWNKNNVSCEFYAWRKFMGIKGRQA